MQEAIRAVLRTAVGATVGGLLGIIVVVNTDANAIRPAIDWTIVAVGALIGAVLAILTVRQ